MFSMNCSDCEAQEQMREHRFRACKEIIVIVWLWLLWFYRGLHHEDAEEVGLGFTCVLGEKLTGCTDQQWRVREKKQLRASRFLDWAAE